MNEVKANKKALKKSSSVKSNMFAKEERNAVKFVAFGLAGASFASLLSFLQLQKLDTALSIGIICFGVSIPCNIFFGIIAETNSSEMDFVVTLNFFVYYLGVFTAVLGIIMIFWHFNWVYGVVFISSCILILLFSTLNSLRIKK